MDGINRINPTGPTLATQARHFMQALKDVRGGLTPAEEPETTTILGYKLDWDEPGLLKNARASQSQLAVTGQEISNAIRLKNDALARGETILRVKIDYSTDIVDGVLAIRAGHTEVVSMKRPEAEYTQLGRAHLEANLAAQGQELMDDAALRALTGGLLPGDSDEDLTIPEIFEREREKAEEG